MFALPNDTSFYSIIFLSSPILQHFVTYFPFFRLWKANPHDVVYLSVFVSRKQKNRIRFSEEGILPRRGCLTSERSFRSAGICPRMGGGGGHKYKGELQNTTAAETHNDDVDDDKGDIKLVFILAISREKKLMNI